MKNSIWKNNIANPHATGIILFCFERPFREQSFLPKLKLLNLFGNLNFLVDLLCNENVKINKSNTKPSFVTYFQCLSCLFSIQDVAVFNPANESIRCL